jgi:UDP-N-acetylglucosamine diphosphorylase/glucosamine-1-phosphate N-acetyltransferase
MSLRICIYEDQSFSNFYPLTLLRPVYTLRAGILPLFSRSRRYFQDADITLIARDALAAHVADQYRDNPVNMIKRSEGQDILFLNGRIRSYGNLPDLVAKSRLSTVFKRDGETVAVLYKIEALADIPTMTTPDTYVAVCKQQSNEFPDFETTATLYSRLWDIMSDIEGEVAADYAFLRDSFKPAANVNVHNGAYLVRKENIHFDGDNDIGPGAVIDASAGPVYIGANTRIESHAAIFGPCFVGANSVVLAGKVVASSIGHTCRVGGEVEESIFQAYVNKYHAGFIGHSYVGPWVNFGAMTTNSDLKNNYSAIRTSVGGSSVDTGLIKVGSFIGDHTKFGIGTLLNTGINIGICCNIFGSGLTKDKEIPSFRWGNTGEWKEYTLDKAINTARTAMERRNTTLTDHETKLLRHVAEGNLKPDGILEF